MKARILRLFFCALLLACVAPLQAGVKNATTLCVENTKGEIVKFALKHRPKVLFKGTYVIVQGGEVKMLKFRELVRAYFEAEPEPEPPTGVNNVVDSQGSLMQNEGAIMLSNFKPLTTVLVYTTAGTLVKRAQATADGTLTLTTADLPAGNYIIKAGKTSFKFCK